MKKQTLPFKLIIVFLVISILSFIGCYQFDFVNQPFSAEPGSSFETEISVTMRPGTGAGNAIPYFGILLPVGWTVNDSIVFYYENAFGMLVYSDSLTQLMYGIEPVPLFYHWWVAEGTGEVFHCVNMTYHLSPVINTDDQPGMFYLDYMTGDNSNGLNRERSNDHLITIGLPENITVSNSNDSGPGSLRSAIDAVDFYGSIYFDLDQEDTIILEEELTLYKDISIHGPQDIPVIISGNQKCRVLNISEGRDPSLSNLHIVMGNADIGGGIYCGKNSSAILQNITVTNNSADKGGGVYCAYGASVIFDSFKRSSIYQNSALWGNDIYSETPVELVLDTFTVLYPTEYHLFPMENFTCDIMNGKIQQVNSDLFVSPEGDNSNSGLTAEDPLQTIDFAFCIIRADSLNQNVIHLMNGIYGPSSNNERFPVIVPDFISLYGESETGVILDAGGQSKLLIIDQNSSSTVSGMTITGGSSEEWTGGLFCSSSTADLDHITIRDNPCCGMYISGSEITFTYGTIIHNTNTGSGGGIRCSGSNLLLNNSIISNNCSGSNGGGIYFQSSNPVLQNVTISHNSAEYGGGIHGYSTNILFDSTNRCNIYLNSASYGNDLRLHTNTHIILDTFSVLYPTEFYVDPLENCSFDILNCKVQQADADLYISPGGNDANGGLTADDPLKTIRSAMSRIISDSSHHNTIRLLEGIYGPSANGEVMPVIIPSFYTIRGTSAAEVILDAEGQSGALVMDKHKEIIISDLTITGGDAEYGGGISCKGCLTLQNAVITGNVARHGAGIDFGGADLSSAYAVLQNVLICDNKAADRGGGIYCSKYPLHLQNVTITNNEGVRGGGLFCENGSGVNIQNSIISGNTGEVYFLSFNLENYVYSYYSNINGLIETFGNGAFIWAGGNISENPLFSGSGDHPYALSQDSPCIDTGNPDTLGLNILQQDIMGNYRIWDGDGNDTAFIDMGAYEFGSLPVGIPGSGFQVPGSGFQVEVYPNPAGGIVDCRLSIVDCRRVTLKIYDLYGREVRTLLDEVKSPGKFTVKLDVSNLPAGVYLVWVQAGKESAMKKLVVHRA